MDSQIIVGVAKRVLKNLDMEEDECTLCFDQAGFFTELGYKVLGVDIRSQKILRENEKKPDRFCRDDIGNTIFVFESKRPSDDEFSRVSNPTKNKWLPDFWSKYVLPLKARYGVLTNGRRFTIYERIGTNYVTRLDIADISLTSTKEAKIIDSLLKKPERKFSSIKEVTEYVESDLYDGLLIDDSLYEFYESYRLIPESLFGKLLEGVIAIFESSYKEKSSNFTTVAFDFWMKSYAAIPNQVPDVWKQFKGFDEKNPLKFMFCLESSHIILARLILAKVCEDFSFPGVEGVKGVKKFISRYDGKISEISYPLFFSNLLVQMRDRLVESIFEEDIYSWWTDVLTDFKTLGDKKLSCAVISKSLLSFSISLRQIIFSIGRFSFSTTKEDLLGNLYQSYFDKETRKALGEFYTRNEIVDYILDEVGYKNGTLDRRLLDPCCGSGTFVIGAVRRYLKDSDTRIGPNPLKYCQIMRGLCLTPRIVALDIHPFAAIITQIRFMIELVPYYLKAILEDPNLIIRRLPVFRADSLEIESKSETRTLWTFEADVVSITIKLPIRTSKGEFHNIKVSIPDKRIVFSKTDLRNSVEYFSALQALFDTVKKLARDDVYDPNSTLLKTNLSLYLTGKDFEALTALFLPSAAEILKAIKSLKYEFGDGRLVKSVEDVVLASILKNYIAYDVVVANPPYIRAFRGEEESRLRYREQYSTPFGSFDTYAVFIERFVRWLSKDGLFGIITSNKYFLTDYGSRLRPFISNNCQIMQLIDLTGCPDAFEEPLVSACILIAKRGENEKIDNSEGYSKTNKGFNDTLIALVKKNELKLLDQVSKDYQKGNASENEELDTYWIKQKELPQGADGTWEVFVTPRARKILAKVSKNANLIVDDSVGEIRGGVRGTEYSKIESSVQDGLPKHGVKAVKLLNVSSIGHFHSRWGKPVKYRWKLYRHPYLVYDKELFSDPLWETFETPKIIIRGVAKELTAYYDNDGVGLLRAIWTIIPKRGVSAPFIVGLLNSELYDFIHKVRNRSARIPEGSYSYSMGFVSSLSIRIPKTKDEKSILVKIEKLVKRIEETESIRFKIQLFPESYLHEDDETEDEVIMPHVDLSFDDLAVIKNLAGYLVILKESSTVHTTSQIANEINIEYLTNALRNLKLRRGQETRIRFVHGDRNRKRIVQENREDCEKLRNLESQRYLDDLNSVIYEYYDLKEPEIQYIGKIVKEMSIARSSDEEDLDEIEEA